MNASGTITMFDDRADRLKVVQAVCERRLKPVMPRFTSPETVVRVWVK
ncbi:hypothetical protein LMG22037_04882 [Paraburkholderia phenoliruptrix]|uniref:Uncharacterized protein n=1 Tax=Paraburkholderia phenoliruptrix TaxID=252970 RepID=A0A6J5C012_9BURK|nr:hypothetical protein LMG22037_04882 [Paraburkholderia phenoliruptrix]